jgi:hypothetical protein
MKSFIFLFTLLSFYLYGEIFQFIPPPHWEYANPSSFTKHVHAGFLGKGSKNFRPSLNFASESLTNLSQEDYVEAVKEIYQADSSQDFLDLGTLSTPLGDGRLLKIQSKSTLGNIAILQFIFVQGNHTAYILSGSVAQEELLSFYKTFLEVFRSVKITQDLFSQISTVTERNLLQQRYTETLDLLRKEKKTEDLSKKGKKIAEHFEKFLTEKFAAQGSYWKLLVLKKLYEDFQSSQK